MPKETKTCTCGCGKRYAFFTNDGKVYFVNKSHYRKFKKAEELKGQRESQ